MLRERLWIFGRELLFQIAPPIAVALGNHRIQAPTSARQDTWRNLPLDSLVKVIGEEWERAKSLDDRLVRATTALSISGAVGGAAARPLIDGLASSPAKVLVIACVLVAIVSLFSGIIMGFAGLRPKPRGGIGPDFAVLTARDDEAARSACIKALAGFEVSNMRRANEADGANTAIRNGILAFVLATLVGLLAPRAPSPAPPPAPIASATVRVSTVVVVPVEPVRPAAGVKQAER